MGGPENTSNRDPLHHLIGSMGDGMSGYITGMEAEGQRQMVESTVLPVDAPWADNTGMRAPRDGVTLESLGFVKTDPVAGDDLFVNCTLPEGWSRAGTEHALWSAVADERGIERVVVFYKAAFYDRHAHAGIVHVGSDLASKVIYSDEPVALPGVWGVLTAQERADLVARCERYIEEQKEYLMFDRSVQVERALRLVELAREAEAGGDTANTED